VASSYSDVYPPPQAQQGFLLNIQQKQFCDPLSIQEKNHDAEHGKDNACKRLEAK
jgi:hypothetical protein